MLSAARNHNNRGRGCGGWNGRAGGQQYGGNGSTASKKKDEKKLLKFHPLVKGKHPNSSFDEVKKELVLNLERSDLEKADDIIDCVRNMVLLDLDAARPTLMFSNATTRAQEERENKALKETHQYDMKKWDLRVDALANNKRKLHAKIIKFCSDTMKLKLEQESGYEQSLYNDLIGALLKRIKKFMTTSNETDWEFFTLWESLRKFVNTVQGSNETPNEFRKRFEERSRRHYLERTSWRSSVRQHKDMMSYLELASMALSPTSRSNTSPTPGRCCWLAVCYTTVTELDSNQGSTR